MTKLRLVADNVRSYEWQSFPRREPKPPRERLGPIGPLCISPNREPQLVRAVRAVIDTYLGVGLIP
jgi:hypothetical protein